MLILIRGIPGSGKSTLARELQENITKIGFSCIHLETDMFFNSPDGYKFDPEKLRSAHRWCQDTAHIMLLQGYTVIVSNTFTQNWEMEPYINNGLGNRTIITTCTGDYQNVHGVQEEKVEQMRQRWEFPKPEWADMWWSRACVERLTKNSERFFVVSLNTNPISEQGRNDEQTHSAA